jgi:chromosome segregation ATPase
MAEDRIDIIIDQTKIEQQFAFLEKRLDDIATKLKSFGVFKLDLQGADSVKKLSQAHTELQTNVKAYEQLQGQVITTQSKINVLQTEEARILANLKVQRQQANKELDNQAKIGNTVTGTLDNIKARVAELQRQKGLIPTFGEENIKQIEKFNKRIDNLNNIVQRNQDEISKRKINVGNYEGSAKIIVDAFERARIKLDQVNKTIGPTSPEAQAARREFEASGSCNFVTHSS